VCDVRTAISGERPNPVRDPGVMLKRRRSVARVPGLLARSRSSSNTFAEFYEQMSQPVLRFFVRQTRDGHRAFDLTAETFAKAFENRQDFRGATDEQAAAWLWRIARNELARYRRSRSVELAAARRLGLERPAPTAEELRHVERLTAVEVVRERIQDALKTLPPDQREILRLRFLDELSYHEIAQQLGVSYDVVRARTSRALRALRDSEQLYDAFQALET
jgi:RNA polymerase sigma factor (sigma-70 family)